MVSERVREFIGEVITVRRVVEGDLRNVGAMLMGVECHLSTAIHRGCVDEGTVGLIHYWCRRYERRASLLRPIGSDAAQALQRLSLSSTRVSIWMQSRAPLGERLPLLVDYLNELAGFLIAVEAWIELKEIDTS